MLHVFRVDTGTSFTFDITDYATHPVSDLQLAIEDECQVNIDHQVLIVSGGEHMDALRHVASYCAGTENNPFFLFSKYTIECQMPPEPSLYISTVEDMTQTVNNAMELAPSYEAVLVRTKLAITIYETAQDILENCTNLVQDQRMQHHGWCAVVANLEELVTSVTKKFESFYPEVEKFAEDFKVKHESLTEVSVLLEEVKKLEVPSAIVLGHRDSVASFQSLSAPTLYDWISDQSDATSLHDLSEQCVKAYNLFTSENMDAEKKKAYQSLERAAANNMKQIGGVTDRLNTLDSMLQTAHSLVDELHTYSQGFVANQQRASSVADQSVFPDLCSSHSQQLLVMLRLHNQIKDIRKRCVLAKEELSKNIHSRLRWIMHVERQIVEAESKMQMLSENLRRLQLRLEFLDQLQLTPKLYAETLVELFYRNHFSKRFISWANNFRQASSQLINGEIKRRKLFDEKLSNHFLSVLFNGLSDYPPKIATNQSIDFDKNLPLISDIDILQLSEGNSVLKQNFQTYLNSVSTYDSNYCSQTKDINAVLSQDAPISFPKLEPVDQSPSQSSANSKVCKKSSSSDEVLATSPFQKIEIPPSNSTDDAFQSCVIGDETDWESSQIEVIEDSKPAFEAVKSKLDSLLFEICQFNEIEQKSILQNAEEILKRISYPEPSRAEMFIGSPDFKRALSDARYEDGIVGSPPTLEPVTCQPKSIDSDKLHLCKECGLNRSSSNESNKTMVEVEHSSSTTQTDFSAGTDIDQLIEDHKCEIKKIREEAVEMAKLKMSASNQVMFNEAIQKVTAEKEKIISELRQHIESLNSHVNHNEASIEFLEKSSSERSKDDRIQSLQNQLMCLKVECDSLQKRMSHAPESMLGLSLFAVLKDFKSGDLVVAYYDSGYDHYLLLSSAPKLYFVKPESLQNFKSLSGEVPTTFLGVIKSKDYCHAKKDNNRFKVQSGTKFYRVNLDPPPP